jgi:hypothetical protein
MTTKTKPAAPHSAVPLPGPWLTPPWSITERLQRIEAMGQRIAGYVHFMCSVDNLNGTSAEAKEKAATIFYERMVVLERELGRIQEDLQLG